MRTMHLFAGAGGGLLADLILGHTPIVAVENNSYCCAVLRERAEDGWFPGLQIVEQDIRTVNFGAWAGRVDCIAAGFPCQDISCAGKGAGITGARSGLWTEVLRATRVIRPSFVFLENSTAIRTRGRREIIPAFVEEGYSYQDGKISASDVGAAHQRERWFCLFVANSHGVRKLEPEGREQKQRRWISNGAPPVADRLGAGLEWRSESGVVQEAARSAVEAIERYTGQRDWNPIDAGNCRVDDGLASRMDRIKAAGNGQVPMQVAAAWLILTKSARPYVFKGGR